jgi:hypothetical protein
MATKLSIKSLRRAVAHICKFGDTDVFPHLCELSFLEECAEDIVAELASLDLDPFQPAQAIEALSPKSRYGFRIVHQLQLLEALLLTASAIEIGADLEKSKASADGFGPFAYRFEDSAEASLFVAEHTYRDWLDWQVNVDEQDYKAVIFTDIADFYQRIYIHRVENMLDSVCSNKGVTRFVVKSINNIRSKQSYGIPVGCSASRILAEAVLADSDAALLNESIEFTRFVDDYRIFVRLDQDPYEILSLLAEQLFLSEGLTLNGQKTRVLTIKSYREDLEDKLPQAFDKADGMALQALSNSIYFDEDPDPDELEQLRSMNLVGMLEGAVEKEVWDFGYIKSLFRALRLASSSGATDYIMENLEILLPFAKEILLYFHGLKEAGEQIDASHKERVLAVLKTGAARAVPTIHAWLLEFFVRGVFVIDHRELKTVGLENPVSERQISLIRGLNADINHFRRNKTKFDGIGVFSKLPFILGASCLPKDEYETWINAIKGRMNRPLDSLFCQWAKSKAGKLDKLLVASVPKVDEAAD